MGQNKVRSGARKETNGSGRKIKGKVRGNWEVREVAKFCIVTNVTFCISLCRILLNESLVLFSIVL